MSCGLRRGMRLLLLALVSGLRGEESPLPPSEAADESLLVFTPRQILSLSAEPTEPVSISPTDSSPLRLGPILLVYITYNGTAPRHTLAEVQSMVWGTPGFADAFDKSSWGETSVCQSIASYWSHLSHPTPSHPRACCCSRAAYPVQSSCVTWMEETEEATDDMRVWGLVKIVVMLVVW